MPTFVSNIYDHNQRWVYKRVYTSTPTQCLVIIKMFTSSEWNVRPKASAGRASSCVNTRRGRNFETAPPPPQLPHAVPSSEILAFWSGSFIVSRRGAGIRFPAAARSRANVRIKRRRGGVSMDKLTAAVTRAWKFGTGEGDGDEVSTNGGGQDRKLWALTAVICLGRVTDSCDDLQSTWHPSLYTAHSSPSDVHVRYGHCQHEYSR